MKPIPYIAFILRAVTAGLAIAFIVIFLWPSLADRISNSASTSPDRESPDQSGPFSYAQAVDRTAPAVVNIYTYSRTDIAVGAIRNNRGRSMPLYALQQGMGSGVLLSEDGYILTNHHVINQVQQIEVGLWDGRKARARVMGSDPETDIAVLKIDLDGLPFAPVAESSEVRVGDVVLAIGNALGLSHTVTMGIVSATGRTGQNSELYDDFIQTDAAINFGNSGGALINARGELVGINTRTIGSSLQQSLDPTGGQNIGFAIPISQAKAVMQEIIEYGSVRRGWIGATFNNMRGMFRPDGSEARMGIAVEDVYRDGPAWLAGIRQGDIILSLDGEMISDTNQFLLQIAQSQPGAEVELEVYRRPESFSTYATLIQQPPLP